MTRARLLRSSALWALLGDILPMLAAMAAAPFLLHTLGTERLGVLSLIWVVVGYVSFLDLGLGRAVTVAVAAAHRPGDAPTGQGVALPFTATAVLALLALGLAGSACIGAVVLSADLPLKLSSRALETEVRTALLWMMPSLPLLLMSSALRGHLEGIGAFKALNMVRIPAGIMLVGGPCVAAWWEPDLVRASQSIVWVRCLQLAALLAILAHYQGVRWWQIAARLYRARQWVLLPRLLSFGSWMTLSSVLSSVMVYADRFVIGALLGAGVISFYTVPFDVVSRFPVLIASVCSVLLPELVRAASQATPASGTAPLWRGWLRRSSLATGALVTLCALVGWWVLPHFLVWWMGADFAAHTAGVAQVLLLAFAFNALAQIPYTGLLALGHTKTIARLHALETLPYLALLGWLTAHWGLVGAACACALRHLSDYALLTWNCLRLMSLPIHPSARCTICPP